MGVHQVKGVVRKRQVLSIGDFEMSRKPLLLEVGASEVDGEAARSRRSPRRRLSRTARGRRPRRSRLREPFAAAAVKVDEPEQMVEFFKMVLVEIVEKSPGAGRMCGDLEVVNVPVQYSRTASIVATPKTISHARLLG